MSVLGTDNVDMVRNLHATLDDDVYQEVKDVKDELGLTWEEFVVEAAECLQERDRKDD